MNIAQSPRVQCYIRLQIWRASPPIWITKPSTCSGTPLGGDTCRSDQDGCFSAHITRPIARVATSPPDASQDLCTGQPRETRSSMPPAVSER
ncbi:hypothetical protein C8Q74DRAFT_1225922 [Fomes fomentarius]|nr:hypothetical protein C8Q74DRAFT_1225922 [Fomes fomentarius]